MKKDTAVRHRALRRVLEVLCLALLLAMVLFLALRWDSLPRQIPGHYNGAGEIDRWGDRTELLVMPVFSALLYLMLTGVGALLSAWGKEGALPASAATWFAGLKLATLAIFALIFGFMAMARPLPGWLLPTSLCLAAAPLIGFVSACVRHGMRRG